MKKDKCIAANRLMQQLDDPAEPFNVCFEYSTHGSRTD